METKPNVSRFAELANVKINPNTQAKADEEASAYEFACISSGHFACLHQNKMPDKGTIYVIIKKDDKIGCSCADMTYRCTGNAVCKHVAAFIALEVPPQMPASTELIKKLQMMGWVGGKDDLHPGELLRPDAKEDGNESEDPNYPDHAVPAMPDPPSEDHSKTEMVHYECPKCGEEVDVPQSGLRDWKLKHMDVCKGKKTGTNKKPRQVTQVVPDDYAPNKNRAKPTSTNYLKGTQDVDVAAPHVPGLCTPLAPPVDQSDCPTRNTESFLPSKNQTVPPNLATALCNMQMNDLSATADSDNPFHKSKYADLASVWAAIRKPLTDNGLAILQTTEPYTDGITVVTTLVHCSGESMATRMSAEIPPPKPDKNGQIKPNLQGLGSTLTYLRRYSIAALVGVATVDDDGEAAMGRGDR